MAVNSIGAGAARAASATVLPILFMVSAGHLLNDMMQSVLLSIYPLLKARLALDFVHIGIITLVFQLTASVLQPMIGLSTDKHPKPFSLPFGMASTFLGMLALSVAGGFTGVLLAAALIGVGSSVFHPEASRVARLASGGRYGLGQSLFQVGGNTGSAIGPLLAAFIIVPRGQTSIAWFSAAALLAMLVLVVVGNWYNHHRQLAKPKARAAHGAGTHNLSRGRVLFSIAILVALLFS